MAKQNFLNGGYVGKLGQTVGQRWKDKKIIRSYAVPANPKTPAQEANRQLFATANRLAQEAMRINGHQGIWDTSQKPEYAQRVGQAMRRLLLGYSEQDSLPLYPEGQAPAVKVVLNNITYDGQAAKYTITTNGFGVQTPTTATINFYSPLYYLGNAFTQNVIHASIDAAQNAIIIDLSANNAVDSQDTKNRFQTAATFGFLAMTAQFQDQLGTPINSCSIQRKYAIAGKLYDFDESLPIVETQDKVVLDQPVRQQVINGSITAFNTTGFPIVYNVSSENTYYAGLAQETLTTNFIRQDSNQDKAFTLLSQYTSGNLENSTTTTYAITLGATQPQVYKDTSTKAYPQPTQNAVVQDIIFGANSVSFVLDKAPVDDGVFEVAVQITYLNFANSTGGKAVLRKDLNGAAIQTNTITITDNECQFLAGGWIGDFTITYKNNMGGQLPAFSPATPDIISNKFIKATGPINITLGAGITAFKGKAINGNQSFKLKATGTIPANSNTELIAQVTYTDNSTEIRKPDTLLGALTATDQEFTISGFDATKEIKQMRILAVAANTTNPNGQPYASDITASVPAMVKIEDAAVSYDDETITFTLPEQIAYMVSSVHVLAQAYLIREGMSIFNDTEFNPADTGVVTVTGDFNVLETAYDTRSPFILDTVYFYEDGSQVTTSVISVFSPAAETDHIVVDENAIFVTSYAEASINTNGGDTATITFPDLNDIAIGTNYNNLQATIEDENQGLTWDADRNACVGASANSLTVTGTGGDAITNQLTHLPSMFPFWTGTQENMKYYYPEI